MDDYNSIKKANKVCLKSNKIPPQLKQCRGKVTKEFFVGNKAASQVSQKKWSV